MAACLTKGECDVCERKETILVTLGIMQKVDRIIVRPKVKNHAKSQLFLLFFFLPREAISSFPLKEIINAAGVTDGNEKGS